MSLLELKEYLCRNESVSLGDLSLHFRVSSEVLEPMLELWMRKGNVRRRTHTGCCEGKRAGCSCGGGGHVLYEWIGP
ncbi:hypothetical protein CHL67_08795 [Prosthecochloris sp. GSB1]|uniref:FeoC-like transcriptional regulator n=1 Tax=Prosthecochloris sp. GSB1 TaxID=281093 RepID=UPI000B8C950D|nr:FeoC-like transcriptional regulator [Prosthecochloris sp. GSB1]ASQ91002.1 hypothetical protein CHL67_08795 [Prosthecochloris sp. GSB1]